MTPAELREKRQHALEAFAIQIAGDGRKDEYFNTSDTLDELDALDKEAIPQNTFYGLVNEMDGYRRLLGSAQGNPARIVMVLDMINALCVRHAEKLEKEIAK